MFCRTTLNYVPRAAGGTGGGPTEVVIRNGREADLPGWEACGFQLVSHEASVSDWDDDGQLAAHHREMAALARRLTGCDHATVGGHIKRGPEQAARHKDLAPITLVHSDFADSYGERLRERYRTLGDEASTALEQAGIPGDVIADARRLVILQFWRNLGPEKMDLPLAFCDARTVPRDDVRAFPVTNYAGEGFDFDALGIVAPDRADRHEWYTFPELRIDEVVAFRTFDTDRVGSGEPYWTPHSAFRDPDVALGRPSRTSIELRATCVFV